MIRRFRSVIAYLFPNRPIEHIREPGNQVGQKLHPRDLGQVVIDRCLKGRGYISW